MKSSTNKELKPYLSLRFVFNLTNTHTYLSIPPIINKNQFHVN